MGAIENSRNKFSTDSDSETFSDGYDEHLMGDEDDKAFLLRLTELDRELELYERFERRQHLKRRFEIERKLRHKKQKAVKNENATTTHMATKRNTVDCHTPQESTQFVKKFLGRHIGKERNLDGHEHKIKKELHCQKPIARKSKAIESNLTSEKPGQTKTYERNEHIFHGGLDDGDCSITFDGKTYQNHVGKRMEMSGLKVPPNEEKSLDCQLEERISFDCSDEDDCIIIFEGKTLRNQVGKRLEMSGLNQRFNFPCIEIRSHECQLDEQILINSHDEDECRIKCERTHQKQTEKKQKISAINRKYNEIQDADCQMDEEILIDDHDEVECKIICERTFRMQSGKKQKTSVINQRYKNPCNEGQAANYQLDKLIADGHEQSDCEIMCVKVIHTKSN